MTLEDDLFYACTNYCNALNHYKTAKEEVLYKFGWTEEEKANVMYHEKNRVKHSLDILKEVIIKIGDGDVE